MESCSSTGKFNKNDRKGNMINWKIVPSGRGPQGIQLYNMLSVNNPGNTFSENWRVVLENVAFGRLQIDPRAKSISRFNELEQKLKPVIIFQPCTGKILMNDAKDDKGLKGIQLFEKTLADVNSPAWSIWSIRDPAEIDEKDNNFSMDV